MKNLKGKTAILTGASGGLGVYLAHELAKAGVNLVLVSYPGIRLESLREDLERLGVRAKSIVADLSSDSCYGRIVEESVSHFGEIDLLINNAGIESTSYYHELPGVRIKQILQINLEAPMQLTRLVIPEMIKRGEGHIVNISSLAGKAAPAFQECYAASKSGLIAFTTSLRASYAGTGVSASVICPGFVEAGIYQKLKETSGVSAPALLGTSLPERVAKSVINAIRRDSPEIIINPMPVRPLIALTALLPRLGQWIVKCIGAHDFFNKVRMSQTKSSNKIVAPSFSIEKVQKEEERMNLS